MSAKSSLKIASVAFLAFMAAGAARAEGGGGGGGGGGAPTQAPVWVSSSEPGGQYGTHTPSEDGTWPTGHAAR